ncbi:Uncharacterised protein [Mycobacteroides abscessus subsp. abscessus]|uniref:DUF4926 domain-containing protein n=1 Tax=Mycobacteroides abscessus TaxID=36809 RepID=UPI000927C65E|nr:DUF4926 domain-containing protein [Mycobacteroides abscessus]SIM05340.1 Uncharacterised protein [Mycobacteroides abscessus subsp. abscessus]SLC77545.1 Uncharacterised protein [Mycobacteroides abscessus subsp. abscessus]
MGTVDRADADPPRELDVVKLLSALRTKDERDDAMEYADCRDVTLPAGSIGTVLVITELPGKPTGYLIEFSDDEGAAIAMPWLTIDDFEVIERHCD